MKALIAFAIVLGASAPALACTARPCPGPLRFFPQAQVPANEFYFEVLVDDTGRIELRDLETGAPIPAGIRALGSARVFAPDVPLRPGQQVEVSAQNRCDATETDRFTIGPDVTRDGSPPRLQVIAQGIRVTDGGRHPYSFVELTYASPGLPGSQTDVAIAVDGRHYTRLYGSDEPRSFRLMAYCDGTFAGDSCGDPGTWSPGRHKVRLTTSVVGEASHVQDLEIVLDCGDGGRVTSGELVANPELRTEGVDDQGCQLGGTNGGGLLTALLALALRRRSRSR